MVERKTITCVEQQAAFVGRNWIIVTAVLIYSSSTWSRWSIMSRKCMEEFPARRQV
jgi:hypothetical protein